MSPRFLRATLLVAALAPALLAEAAPLSLDQAMELAVQRSESARSARAGAQGAAEMARAAGQLPDPMLAFGIDNLPATGRDRFNPATEDMTMKRIGLSQEWVPAERRSARQAAAMALADRESTMEQIAAGEARLQAAMAYVEAWYAGEALRLATRGEHHAHEAQEATTSRLATPSGSSAEVLMAASEQGAAEDESAEQQQQQAAALSTLQRWVGVMADELLPPRLPTTPAEPSYVAAHPAVLSKERDVALTRQEAELARLARRPSWTYELSYGQRQGRPDLVSFGVTIPLTVAPAARQDRETAAKLAMVDKAEAELEEARRTALGEYAALTSDERRLAQRIERFRGAVLTPLQQRSAAMLAAYRSNQASLAMLFEARHAELESERKLVSLQRELARTRVQLVYKPIATGVAP
ncbi:TolC family protein [Ideonella sp. YS5]|uniref:TolC family protein n=1 Tax=Ideonella sp. YS5 TaxID=3453714 RepID=UPI003EEE8307